MADAAQAQRNRDLARHHAADPHCDRVRRDVLAVVLEEVLVLALADVDAAATAADDHAGIGLGEAEAGVVPGFTRGHHAEERRPRVAPGIGAGLTRAELAVERGGGRNVDGRHRRGHPAGIGRHVEFGNRPRAALAAP